MAHEYTQYGKPVSLHTLHCDPGGQVYIEQTMENKVQIVSTIYVYSYILYNIQTYGTTAWVVTPAAKPLQTAYPYHIQPKYP